jgi:hypothetical protein
MLWKVPTATTAATAPVLIPMSTGTNTVPLHSSTSITSDILDQTKEEHIQLPLAAIRASGIKPNGDPVYSAHLAVQDVDVLRTTLDRRLKDPTVTVT